MTNRTVNRLLGLEIDEVSLVDRPANQHGLVTITKRDEGGMGTGLYDEQGVEYSLDELEPGMEVFDADGTQVMITDDDEAAELEAQGYEVFDLEVPDDLSGLELEEPTLATVGKAGGAAAITGGARTAFVAGRNKATQLLGHADGNLRRATGSGGRDIARAAGRDTAAFGRRNRNALAAGGAAGAGGYGAGRMHKSAGQQVLEELSKAYTDADRDQVIAKALDALQDSDRRASNAERIAKALQTRAEVEQYVELAKSYSLPVDDRDLGVILHAIAKNAGLSDDQLDLVDRVFCAAGEAIFVEKGVGGTGGESGVMDQLQAAAYELVTKADVTAEQALVAMIDANPNAYLDYLNEQ